MQQGGCPSPFDRSIATKMAAKSYKWLVEQITANLTDGKVFTKADESACLLGMRTRRYQVIL